MGSLLKLSEAPPAIRDYILAKRQLEREHANWNYVVSYPNGRVKVGVTGDPRKRFAYYVQEATRHDLGDIDMHASGADLWKSEVLLVERILCTRHAWRAVPRHREWLLGSDDFATRLTIEMFAVQDEVRMANFRLNRPFHVVDHTVVLHSWVPGFEFAKLPASYYEEDVA